MSENSFYIVAMHLSDSTLGTSDFDDQMPGIKFWKGDENLRPVYKKRFLRYIEWLPAFWTL